MEERIENSEGWRKWCAWNSSSNTESAKLLYRPEYMLMTGYATCGLLLAWIVYWSSYSKDGKIRLRFTDKQDSQLYHCDGDAECGRRLGLSRSQICRARRILAELSLVEARAGGHEHKKTVFYKLNHQEFMRTFDLVSRGELDRRPRRSTDSESGDF